MQCHQVATSNYKGVGHRGKAGQRGLAAAAGALAQREATRIKMMELWECAAHSRVQTNV